MSYPRKRVSGKSLTSKPLKALDTCLCRHDEFKIRTTVQFRGNDAKVRQLYNSQAEHKLPNILFIVIIFAFYNNPALPGSLRS